MTLDYYYGDQAEQFSFYRIPKVLFTDSRFKDISAEAKILYGLLLDRMSLSAKNGWLDQEGRVYIVYTVENIMDALSCASQKAMKLLNELDDRCGLIERKRQGLGKPNLIYVKNFVAAPGSKFKNGENQNSGLLKIETQEFPKSKGSNTEKNNTDLNDTESLPFTSFRGSQKRESKRNDAERRSQYRELIMENISYATNVRHLQQFSDSLPTGIFFWCAFLSGHNINLQCGASILHHIGGLHKVWDGLGACSPSAFRASLLSSVLPSTLFWYRT